MEVVGYKLIRFEVSCDVFDHRADGAEVEELVFGAEPFDFGGYGQDSVVDLVFRLAHAFDLIGEFGNEV